MDVLTADVAALVAHLGERQASVAGHDWGGAVAWNLPRFHPGLVERLVILNAPHPRAFRRELAGLEQLLRSWYIFFFQVPFVPELAIELAGFAPFEKALVRLGGRLDPSELALYREAWKRPGALTAGLNYYRAAVQLAVPAAPHRPSRIDTPTLLIWGEKDPALGVALTQGLEPWVSNLRVERLPRAGHWVHWDEPAAVNRLMRAFLSDGRSSRNRSPRPAAKSRRRSP